MLQHNLNAIKKNKLNVIEKKHNDYVGEPKFTRAKSGSLSCYYENNNSGLWLHSRYDPLREAKKYIEKNISYINSSSKIVVYGFGCAHHIRELLSVAGSNVFVEMLEVNVNYFLEALKHDNFCDIFGDKRVLVKVTDNLDQIQAFFSDWQRENPLFLIYQPSLQIIPPFFDMFKNILEEYLIHQDSCSALSDLLISNFNKNLLLESPGIERFVNLFNDMPVIMVSAGPSLEKNVGYLRAAGKHCLVCSVGTALKPLLKNGFVPDFIMITDPKELIMDQIAGVDTSELPLFYLSTVYEGVVRNYQGPKFIIYQKGFPMAEERAAELGVELVDTGGSVATTLFDMLTVFGFNPICLVGQDLAYTNNQTHVEGAHNFIKFQDTDTCHAVTNFERNGYVKTSKNLAVYLKWFEERAKGLDINLYNATEGGAYITGFKHIKLSDFIKRHQHIDISRHRLKLCEIVRNL